MEVEDRNDIEWIMRFRESKDPQAFRCIYEKYYPAVLSFISLYRNDELDSKDIVQNTFVKLYERPDLYNIQYSLKTWLFTIARNLMVNEFKRRKTAEKNHKKYAQNANLGEDRLGAHTNRLQQIDEAVSKLSEVHKDAFLLKYHHNFSIAEISEICQCSTGTVKSRIHYALKNIKELLSTLK